MDINPTQNINAVSISANEEPTIENLLSMYKSQQRECWLCDKIVKNIEAGKNISDDDKWHFSSCVLSWEHVHFIRN